MISPLRCLIDELSLFNFGFCLSIMVSEAKDQGLKQNWKQFLLLVVVNAFVGGMVGMERTIFPSFAEQQFSVASKTAMLSFIIAFGISKALANYYTGKFANRFGRRKLLIFGWFLAIPVPVILLFAPSWSWVVFANVLLGISQGLTWSSTVVMKIDLVGEKDRGLAMGLNEFGGYLAVGVVAYFTGYLANKYGVLPYPFYTGLAIAVTGFILSLLCVKDTAHFIQHEVQLKSAAKSRNVFLETSFKNKTLSAVTQAGLVNNLNDGMIWGLLPVFLSGLHFDANQTGIIAAVYPTVWGLSQVFTGKMADHFSKKSMLFWGMTIQGMAIIFISYTHDFNQLLTLAVILGLGTALVYPTFLATIADAVPPTLRAESIGVFRLWRDLGYAVGAVLSGITADIFGIGAAIILVGILTLLSALIIQLRMKSNLGKNQLF